MNMYRIKHIPTGLYWRNHRVRYNKHTDQLHQGGKVFYTPDCLRYVTNKDGSCCVWHNDAYMHIPAEDLIVEEVV